MLWIIVLMIIGLIYQLIFAKPVVKNASEHLKRSNIEKCVKLLGNHYAKIDCNIYFINNESDFNKYAKNKVGDFYTKYRTGELHGLCCSKSDGSSIIFVFTNNSTDTYGLERYYYQKAVLRVLFHELRHAYQNKNNLQMSYNQSELDADTFAAKALTLYDKKINEIFKNYKLHE